jgi:hypothetical protein
MFAEVSQMEVWMLISQVVMALATVGALLFMAAAFNKRQKVQFQQPVSVTITEELHKVFASKENFDKHIAENRHEHDNIFSKIGGVDRGTGAKISTEVTAIHARINLLDKATGRLEAATEFQNQQLAQMDSKITRLLERKS